MGFSTFSGFKNDKYTFCIAFYAVLSVYRSGYADTEAKPRNSLGHRVLNVPEVQQKLRCLRCILKQIMPCYAVTAWKGNKKDDFLTKSFSSSTKRKLSILFNFLFPFVSFNSVFSTSEAELWSWKPPHYNRAAAILLTHKRFTKV